MASTQEEADKVEEEATPPTPVIHETVRRNGEHEMNRPATSLAWSGLAAGFSMSFSLYAQAVLQAHLPEASWRELVVALGYPVGFVMVVLSRQQLFTENTITVVLPVMAEPSWRHVGAALRMWAIVLAANLAGTAIAAAFYTRTPLLPHETLEALRAVATHAMAHEPLAMGLLGIVAGYLMAATVWLIPDAGQNKMHVIVMMTWLIGAFGLAHIVVGSAEGFALVFLGDLALGDFVLRFALPTLAGNIVGGTALFAVIAHGQVMNERE